MKDFAKFFIFNVVVWTAVFGVAAANAQQTMTITVPADTKVIEVDSSYCEPIYNENTGSLYVPRCWKLKQQEREVGMGGRILDRAIEQTAQTVENSISNGIDRHIYDLGRKTRDIIYPR